MAAKILQNAKDNATIIQASKGLTYQWQVSMGSRYSCTWTDLDKDINALLEEAFHGNYSHLTAIQCTPPPCPDTEGEDEIDTYAYDMQTMVEVKLVSPFTVRKLRRVHMR